MEVPKPKNVDIIEEEIRERELALEDLRHENFSMLHEDEPAAAWIKYVPIASVALDLVLILIIFFKK